MTDYVENTCNYDMHTRMFMFWESVKKDVETTKPDANTFKGQELPLARIKKIMKLDDDVKPMMISAEAPILFAKACEIFIKEITLRAWIHTEQNRRRTLQRNDISMAISDNDTDQFDFLIDIVPREESRPMRKGPAEILNKMSDPKLATQMDTSGLTSINGDGQTAQGIPQGAMLLSNPAAGVNGSSQGGLQFLASPQTSIVNGQQQQVQYVLQLPMGANTSTAQTIATSNGSYAIQMVQQPFQTTAGEQQIAGLPPGSIIQQGPNGTLQVVQMPAPNAIMMDANGDADNPDTKMNAIQNQQQQQQQQQLTQQKQTFYIQQPDGTMIPVDSLGQQVIFTQGPNGQQQPMLISLGDMQGTVSAAEVGVENHVGAGTATAGEVAEDGNTSPLTRSAAKRKAAAGKAGAAKSANKRSKPNIPTSSAPILVTKIDEDAANTENPIQLPTAADTQQLNESAASQTNAAIEDGEHTRPEQDGETAQALASLSENNNNNNQA